MFSVQGTRRVTIRERFTFSATTTNYDDVKMTVVPSSGRILLYVRESPVTSYKLYSEYNQQSETPSLTTCEHNEPDHKQVGCILISQGRIQDSL